MSLAFCCAICDKPDPSWRVTRQGDVVVSWACHDDLSPVCWSLQRDFEVTQLVVEYAPKKREIAEIGRALDAIAEEATP